MTVHSTVPRTSALAHASLAEGRTGVAAIIAAAGESQRMGGLDKLFAPLAGRAILARVIDVFQLSTGISRIVVAVSQANVAKCRRLVAEEGWSKVTEVCVGGRRRQDSVLAGLKRVGACDWVMVHDGARPLVTEDLVVRGLEAAGETGAAVAAVPVTDTIKLAEADMIVRETLPRDSLWAVQTPQVFRLDVIAEAYQWTDSDVTDDAALVEKSGHKVKLYMGSYDNIKVTTPADLALAELLWQRRSR